MPLSAYFKALHVSSLWVYRVLTWSVLVCGLSFAAVVLSLRYWVLPNIERYREDIEQTISQVAKQRVAIGRIAGNWDGIRPELVLENVTVFDHSGRPALELARVDNTLSWLSLVVLELRFHSLGIHRPALDVRRNAQGVIAIAGIELRDQAGDNGFVEWLLRQREIVVRDAEISWQDDMRAAPRLDLKNVTLLVRNRRGSHRFGLSAVPPAQLAAPLDLRGELTFDSVSSLPALDGRIYVKLDYADIAAWRTWVPFPIDFPRGAGAVRAWLTLSGSRLLDAVADVRLANVRMRLAPELPELDLASLAGRVGWKSTPMGFEFSAHGLGFSTEKGLKLAPADFQLRLARDSGGNVLRGEIYANALTLEPLVLLADRLPLGAEVREQLTALSPRGRLFDLNLRWTGDWREPAQYSVRGRFQNVALNHGQRIPGFSGLTGYVEGNERGGIVYLNSTAVGLVMPRVFRDALRFDTLTAQLGWARRGSEHELRMNNVAFANPHLAGTVFGTYQTLAGEAGIIDLTGALTRADARFVKDYLPLTINKSARAWLDNAFLGGQSHQAALRLKGDLAEFPFRNDRGGVFHVTAKMTGGVLNYAPRWPQIQDISGDLTFRGERMEINARQASVLGVALARVNAQIPDLTVPQELLRVSGEAAGPSGEFLAFIEKSPVNDMIGRFAEGLRVQGNGRLALKLELPLSDLEKSRVEGSYQFINNRITAEGGLPPIEQVNGRMEFSDASVRISGLNAVFLGGPVTVSATTQRDATVNINVQGRADIDNLRRQAGSPAWAQRLRGGTDWKGAFVLRNKAADLVIESSLQGLASDLPAPFVKTAAEAVPLRYERRFVGLQGERINFRYGDLVSAQFLRRAEGGRSTIHRGTIHFGGAAPEPKRDGVYVTGSLKRLDLDSWLELAAAPAEAAPTPFPLAGIDVKVADLGLIGRRFGDVAVNGTRQGGLWHSVVSAREFEGAVSWQPEGRGRITARMKRLALPAAPVAAATTDPAARRTADWPALDILAEQFQLKDKALGRLELVAAPAEREWRIERLVISNPDGTLNADGAWRSGAEQPRMQVNLRLTVSDIGKLLARLNYPEGVRRGTAKIEGSLNWPGGPQQFDYPGLSGNLVLDARQGQFAKLEPGIGKLLGILSLQSLPRRITLDFRDIFSGGFAFDEIVGTVSVNRGIANTDGLRIQGPAARVLMSGEVDLARETQKLDVKITPSLSDSVALAGALIGGPVAGVAAFIAQKVLKDPFERIAAYEYRITGTWNDPQVSKIGKSAPPETDRSQ